MKNLLRKYIYLRIIRQYKKFFKILFRFVLGFAMIYIKMNEDSFRLRRKGKQDEHFSLSETNV